MTTKCDDKLKKALLLCFNRNEKTRTKISNTKMVIVMHKMTNQSTKSNIGHENLMENFITYTIVQK